LDEAPTIKVVKDSRRIEPIPCRCVSDSPKLTRPAKVEANANDSVFRE
jgi:hypothetical protein